MGVKTKIFLMFCLYDMGFDGWLQVKRCSRNRRISLKRGSGKMRVLNWEQGFGFFIVCGLIDSEDEGMIINK